MKISDLRGVSSELVAAFDRWWESMFNEEFNLYAENHLSIFDWWVRGATGEEGPDEYITTLSAAAWGSGWSYAQGLKDCVSLQALQNVKPEAEPGS